ncbi:Uncharacterized protein HZ326_12870 [Fusarium oxysporum f. sp. albedinis]|nr:Uncharacterized protein HZ326_12870 [Fusarium oxysporum f. sp. albedinis]
MSRGRRKQLRSPNIHRSVPSLCILLAFSSSARRLRLNETIDPATFSSRLVGHEAEYLCWVRSAEMAPQTATITRLDPKLTQFLRHIRRAECDSGTGISLAPV